MMKKKKILILLLGSLPFSLPASSLTPADSLAKVGELLRTFKNHASEAIGGCLSFLGAKLPEIGARLARLFSRFVEMNKEASAFLRTTGVDFFKAYPIEILGVFCLLIGLIVFVDGLAYKPRYKLADAPPNAVPLKKKIAPSVAPPTPEAAIKRPSPKQDEGYVVNPLNVPHVEHTDAEVLEIEANKAAREADKAYYDSHADDSALDKEDLEFFRSLARDFDQIDGKLDQ